jgi:hypothetical protein
MAKKDKKKGKKKDNPGTDAVGAVRTAVERTFQATADSAQSTRTRAQDLVDEVAGAAGRLREMIEQVGVLEDLKGLRGEVESLARRVAALETSPKPAARSGAAASGSGTRAKSTGAKSTRAKSTAAKSSGTRAKSTASQSTSRSGTRAKSTAAKSSGTRKPAASRSGTSRSTASRSTSSRSAKKPS